MLLILIDNPNDYFGNETNVIFVEPTDSPEENQPNEINLQNLSKSFDSTKIRIKSNTPIFSNVSDWFFVPFNYNYTSRNVELLNLFIKYGVDITLFKNDLSYAIKNRAKIKEIYNDVTGQINQNSMMVYSGPLGNHYTTIKSYFRKYNYHSFFYFSNESSRVGCIYTGDSDLNIVDIQVIFKRQWK